MAEHAAAPSEPLLTRTAIVHVIAVLSALLVVVGGGDVSKWLDVHADTVAGAVLLVSPFVSAWLARRHVTPVAAPKAATGAPLVEVGSLVAVASPDVEALLASVTPVDVDEVEPQPAA